MKKKIFIRLGHEVLYNGNKTGAKGILQEMDVIKTYGEELRRLLLNTGFEVKIFIPYDKQFTTAEQARIAGIKEPNQWKADLFVSCHANKYNGSASGCEVCCYFKDAKTTHLANDISDRISKKIGIPNRGAKDRSDLQEIKETVMGALIIEPFFIDNQEDCYK